MTCMTTTPTLRERIVAEAAALTSEVGWAAVTMAALAARVGVSRQTVYNELGSKPALGEAMVLRELDRFLGVVGEAFDAHPGDLDGAIRAAVRAVLDLAAESALLRALATFTHGGDTELMPLLTTRSDVLIGVASEMVLGRLEAYDVELEPLRRRAAVDVVVRVVLSHVVQPGGSPAEVADDVAWVATRVLGPV